MTRHPPPAVRAVLRAVHRLIVHQRPYEEVAAGLDAAAALPEAAEPDASALIALERLDAVVRYPVTDADVERAIQLTAAEISALSTSERAWQLGSACWGRPALVLRHLAPLLADLEQREPEDVKTLERLRAELSIARGEPQSDEDDGEDADDKDDSVARMPEELMNGIRYAYRLRRMGWPYEDVIAVLDEVATLPVAAEFTGQLAFDRINLTDEYERPDEEMEREIQATLRACKGDPAKIRASTIMSACSGRPALAEKYVPPLIGELEEALRRSPDAEGEAMLAGVKRRLERTRADG
ncbi:MAG TPA: hypothetical protein VNM90_09285 [Haliangium sp.]|nr:hypothetical protein [Haliangium sp.]